MQPCRNLFTVLDKSSRWMVALATSAIALFTAAAAWGGESYDGFPSHINKEQAYVFYSHGFIVEGTNPTPVHPEYGRYDFPAIKSAIAGIGGFNLIAHHRPAGIDADDYAAQLAQWARLLIDAGVPAEKIVLVGFSRGGMLTAMASSQLRDLSINTVILASCVEGDIQSSPPLSLGGRFLSIYERTDGPGTCMTLAARSNLISFAEIEINTGKSHGAFYTPAPEWISPLADWLGQVLASD